MVVDTRDPEVCDELPGEILCTNNKVLFFWQVSRLMITMVVHMMETGGGIGNDCQMGQNVGMPIEEIPTNVFGDRLILFK
jgi:hypothetical protein